MRVALLGLASLFFLGNASGADDLRLIIVGKWQAANDEKHVAVFEKDGTFRFGPYREKGKEVWAVGRWVAIKNEIRAEARHMRNIYIGLAFQYKDGILSATDESSTPVEWRRVTPGDSPGTTTPKP